MCICTERVEMFIVLYDSSNISFGHIETVVSYNQSREIYFDLFLGKFGS